MSPSIPQNKSILQESTIAIVGVGLIGGSIAAALKQRGFAGKIVGVGRTASRLQQAEQAGLIDSSTTNIAEAAAEASLMIFCTPVDHIVTGVKTAAAHCLPGTLLTDAGSVKGMICAELTAIDKTFIGSHPLAGSEQQGFEHAEANLYQDRVTILTPAETTPDSELARLQQFWEFLGSRVFTMSPVEHDQIVARTSHLPHLVAAALVNAVLNEQTAPFAASGFKDTTRIAVGDADLWNAIALHNRAAILESLEEFAATIEEFRRTLSNSDAEALKNLLQQAKTSRESV